MTDEDLDRAIYLMQNEVDFGDLADVARHVDFMANGRQDREFARAALISVKKLLEILDGLKFQELASLARKTKPLPPEPRDI